MGKSYEDLRVWQNSIGLAKDIYNITKAFPIDEKYGLTNQIQRAAVSVPSNIAEGCARGSPLDFIRFLNMSSGSLAEVKTQLIIATEIGYINNNNLSNIFSIIDEIGKMLNSLKRSIRTNNQQPVTSN